jgi:YggT family protein
MMTVYRLVDFVFWVLDLAILLRVLFSWINPESYNVLVHWVYQLTEPILVPLRRMIPPVGGLDITPMVALLMLQLVRRLVFSLL